MFPSHIFLWITSLASRTFFFPVSLNVVWITLIKLRYLYCFAFMSPSLLVKTLDTFLNCVEVRLIGTYPVGGVNFWESTDMPFCLSSVCISIWNLPIRSSNSLTHSGPCFLISETTFLKVNLTCFPCLHCGTSTTASLSWLFTVPLSTVGAGISWVPSGSGGTSVLVGWITSSVWWSCSELSLLIRVLAFRATICLVCIWLSSEVDVSTTICSTCFGISATPVLFINLKRAIIRFSFASSKVILESSTFGEVSIWPSIIL